VSALVLSLAGCSGGPVEVEVPDTAVAAACGELLEDLPAELAGLAAREVTPSDAPAAAWGDPAVVLTCGAEEPDELDRFSSCLVVGKVGWFVPPSQEEDLDADVVLSAVGRDPLVSLLVPAEHRGTTSATALTEIAPALTDHLEPTGRCS
jgi:hypothetical protein